MRTEEIHHRLAFLHLCLQFSNQKVEILTVYERMLINQERGRLLNELDYPQTIPRPVSEAIEAKLQQIKILIAKYNWQPLNHNNELDGN